MSKGVGAGFVSLSEAEQMRRNLIQSVAVNRGSFTVRQDFMDEITDYLYRSVNLWARIPKEEAEHDIVQEIVRTGLPVTGFANKSDLSTAPQDQEEVRHNLDDPGQEVKALMGQKSWSHYDRSLYEQQGRPFGNQIARDTNDMVASATKELERSLFYGNATANPLEFNGFIRQMPAGREPFSASITGEDPDNIGQKLSETVVRIVNNRTYNRTVTAIWTTGAGWSQVQKQIEEKRLITQLVEFIPGIQVPGILTPIGVIPLVMTPYMDDEPGATNDDPDVLPFYLVDESTLVWKGVKPVGGQDTLEPQLFEVSTYVSDVPLTESRLLLCYGTLKAMRRGDGIWKMNLTAPRGSAWSYTG